MVVLDHLTIIFVSTILTNFVAAEEPFVCKAALDIVQVQDATNSFVGVLPNMIQQIYHIVSLIQEQHEESRYAITAFGDKPLKRPGETDANKMLGFDKDWCFSVTSPLTIPSGDLVKIINNIPKAGGGDWSELGVEALYRAAISPQVGWRDTEHTESGSPVARAMVFVTDAISHFEGDVLEIAGQELPPFNLTAETMLKDGPNAACIDNEYPTMAQVAKILKEKKIFVLLLAAPGGSFSTVTGKFSPAKSLARLSRDYRKEDGLLKYYSDLFDEHGVDYVAEVLRPDMKDFADIFGDLLLKHKGRRCKTTTTTAATTSTPTTTSIVTTITTIQPTPISTVLPPIMPQTMPQQPTNISFTDNPRTTTLDIIDLTDPHFEQVLTTTTATTSTLSGFKDLRRRLHMRLRLLCLRVLMKRDSPYLRKRHRP